MALHYSLYTTIHPNIYNGNKNHNVRIEYALPQAGTNSDTGFLVLVPGFGGHIDSNVYKKMREVFSDKYNLVTLQCDYFGSNYMQASDNYRLRNSFNEIAHHFTIEELRLLRNDITQLLPLFSDKSSVLSVSANLQETDQSFADMGFMQAIDIITSIEFVKKILKKNRSLFNPNYSIGFGDSHGSYLLHLCNRLAPHLFSTIIDNAAWEVPKYLFHNRLLYQQLGSSQLQIEFDYYAKYRIKDKEALDLANLYADFDNGAYIYSYIGTTDNLVDIDVKRKCIDHLPYVEYEVIDEKKVDGTVFRSTDHGLNADFLALVDFIFTKDNRHINPNVKKDRYDIISSNTRIEVDYSSDLPKFQIHSLE